MVNQEQYPPQQEQPFVAAKQLGFNLEYIILNTNNEVALLYPEHNNKDHFKCVSDFISKCFLRKPFTRSLKVYKVYLAGFWYSAKTLENSKVFFSTPTGGIYGEVGVNSFRNSIGAHYLPHSSEYVSPSSIDIVRPWFEAIRYGEPVPIKGTLKKSLLPPRWREKVVPYTRFLSLLMMHKMKEGHGDGELTLYPTQISQWHLKLPRPPPLLRGFPKAQSLELNLNIKSIQLLQNNPLCPAKRQQKVGPLKHPPVPNLAILQKEKSPAPYGLKPKLASSFYTYGYWNHKEDQQATSGPTSLRVTSEGRANSHLNSDMLAFNLNETIYSASFIIHFESASGNDALVASTSKADLGNSALSDFVPQQQGMNKGTKNTSYDHLFADLDSSEDDRVIVVDDSDEDKNDEVHATENVETKDTSVPKSLSHRSS
nr:hypothetical protein [Tanacetum cinerariifolium]